MVEDFPYNEEDDSPSSSTPSSCSSSSANSPSWDDGKTADDESNELSLFEDGAPLEVVEGMIHHRTIRLGGKMLSVMHSDSCDFLIGVQVASLLKRETFNMYRSMKIKSIPIQRATPAQVDFLCKCRAVRSGTHSVTLIPYDTGLVFVSDAFNKMTNNRKSKSKSKRKSKAKKLSSPLHTVLRNRSGDSFDHSKKKGTKDWEQEEKVEHLKGESQHRIRATIFDLIRIVTEPEILSDLHDCPWVKKSSASMEDVYDRDMRPSPQGYNNKCGSFAEKNGYNPSVHVIGQQFHTQSDTNPCKLPSFNPDLTHYQSRLANPLSMNPPYSYLPTHISAHKVNPTSLHPIPMNSTAHSYMNKRRCHSIPYEQEVTDENLTKEKSQEASSTQSLMMLKTILC